MATTNYPGSLDAYPVPNNGDTISVTDHWLGPAVIGIETELGTDPAGYATDLKTRLADINPSEGNLNLDAGYGSKAPIYGVRAWVNFNGTGTVAIRDSGNVSSITDTATGDYTVNFTTAMPDVNYAAIGTVQHATGILGNGQLTGYTTGSYLATGYRFYTVYIASSTNYYDPLIVSVSIIR